MCERNAQPFSVQTAELPAYLCHLDPTTAQTCLFTMKLHKLPSICLRRQNWRQIKVSPPYHLDNEKQESAYMRCIFHSQKQKGFIMHISTGKAYWMKRAKSRKGFYKKKKKKDPKNSCLILPRCSWGSCYSWGAAIPGVLPFLGWHESAKEGRAVPQALGTDTGLGHGSVCLQPRPPAA